MGEAQDLKNHLTPHLAVGGESLLKQNYYPIKTFFRQKY
jgi:hypothetical protein